MDGSQDPYPKFNPAEVGQHIAQYHPNCPKSARKQIIERVLRKTWTFQSLGKAVGICMESYLRHEVTGYDKLLDLGLDQAEVRKMIRPEIEAVLRRWAPSGTEVEPAGDFIAAVADIDQQNED